MTLVNRILRKDVSAFEELYDRYRRVVYSMVLRILHHAPTAEEAVQDIFLKVWQNASRYDISRPFLPWLLTLSRNQALDQLRLKGERQRCREEQTEFESCGAAPEFEVALEQSTQAKNVRAAMETLQSHQRIAIELAYFEGLSHTEIAAKLRKPLGTVKSWIRCGLLQLKEGLQTRLEMEQQVSGVKPPDPQSINLCPRWSQVRQMNAVSAVILAHK